MMEQQYVFKWREEKDLMGPNGLAAMSCLISSNRLLQGCGQQRCGPGRTEQNQLSHLNLMCDSNDAVTSPRDGFRSAVMNSVENQFGTRVSAKTNK